MLLRPADDTYSASVNHVGGSFLSQAMLDAPLSVLPVHSTEQCASSQLYSAGAAKLLGSIDVSVDSSSVLLFAYSSDTRGNSSDDVRSNLTTDVQDVTAHYL